MQNRTIRVVTSILLCVSLLVSPALANKAYASELGSASEGQRYTGYSYSFVFKNLYDPNTFSGTRWAYIGNSVAFTSYIYSQLFDISFELFSAPIQDTYSGINNCAYEYHEPCSFTSICGGVANHHKDIGRIANELYSRVSRAANGITVLWTDFEGEGYCWYKQNDISLQMEHLYVSYCGIVFNHRPVVHIMNLFSSETAQIRSVMGLLLAHETAHCFGLDDVYDQGWEHNDDGTWNCVMDYIDTYGTRAVDFYDSIMEDAENAFCESCRSAMEDKFYTGEYNSNWY